MAIPESQLDTWAHQGSVAQSSSTYNTIKDTLNSSSAPYADKDFEIFLQGSYGNDTNIYAESDVDIVIKLKSSFQHDLSQLTEAERNLFDADYPNATYVYTDFKKDVLTHLTTKYGDAVKAGDKAIMVEAGAGRRKADVIAAITFRRYWKFQSSFDPSFVEGICFYSGDGTKIVNYPKQHSINLTTKHQGTSSWFKPMVRILKNMRSRMTNDGDLDAGVAPSYYIEGLLYNARNDLFGASYGDTFVNCVNWLWEADRSKFLCANEQYYLLNEWSPVTWRAAKCTAYLTALRKLWNDW